MRDLDAFRDGVIARLGVDDGDAEFAIIIVIEKIIVDVEVQYDAGLAISRQDGVEQPRAHGVPVGDTEEPRGYSLLGKVVPALVLFVLQRQQVGPVVLSAFAKSEYRYSARPVAAAVAGFVTAAEAYIELGVAEIGFFRNERQ